MPEPRVCKPAVASSYLAILAAMFLFLLPAGAGAAELVVRCTDGDGSAVRLEKAEFLTYGWGYADAVELRTEGNTAALPLDEAGLSALVGVGLEQIDGFFLYIEAEGFAPVRSASFVPPGIRDGDQDGQVLRFPGGETADLLGGTDVEVGLVLRKPVPRKLILLDDEGRPVEGAEVVSYMYWSSSNHCARLNGAWLLDKAVSGSDGTVEVPDGDFEYAFEIAADDLGLVLKKPELTEYPERLVTMLHDEKTVVNLHRRKSLTLNVRVLKNGVPVSGQMLYGCMADCPGGVCASCCGPLSASGPYGVIAIPGFYPEAYKSIYIQDASGEKLFEADPQKLSLERPIEVDLAACAIQGHGM